MRRLAKDRGQSTVEYVIVFTAIAAAIIFAAVTLIKPAVNRTFNEATEGITKGGRYLGQQIGFKFHNELAEEATP